jgi:hypothetical protein
MAIDGDASLDEPAQADKRALSAAGDALEVVVAALRDAVSDRHPPAPVGADRLPDAEGHDTLTGQ